ncbi:MAG: DNA gyrase C-terminal beta-propeller domain-containing protein, partial [Anaerolineales bacterium]|nr:hypothetical protein [Anaerolineales bacterium]MDW8446108.1 DNA gyrase C-terminal beta-propeller domain-containing protein [Anaerolineales bacterium]
LANIDQVIELIKSAPSPKEAKEQLLAKVWQPGVVATYLARIDTAQARPEDLEDGLGLGVDGYRLSPAQAQAILDLRLHRLTGLEQDKIFEEYQALLAQIDELLAILGSEQRLLAVIRRELEELRDQFGDERRTEILAEQVSLSVEDLITDEDVVVTLTHAGYVKAQPLSVYQAQRRGGKGKAATATKEEDFVEELLIANTHATLLCFSSLGKVYGLKVYELPMASRISRGQPIVNLLPLEEGERIHAVLPVRDFAAGGFVFLATAWGVVKKTPLSEFESLRASGKIAIDLKPGDMLVRAALTDGKQDVMLFSSAGRAVCFNEEEVRSMGRAAGGVRGMRLPEGQRVIALVLRGEGAVLTVTENGYGKRSRCADFPRHGRGGQGVIAMQTTERNGPLVGAVLVREEDEIMLITTGGTLARIRVADIPVLGRNTQGVRIIRLNAGEKLVGVDRIETLPEEE